MYLLQIFQHLQYFLSCKSLSSYISRYLFQSFLSRLGDIIFLAGGNATELGMSGGVIGVEITWNCDLDWDFSRYCLPRY